MKRLTKSTLAIFIIAVVATSCQTQKEEPLYYEDGIVNLHGPWKDQKGPATSEDEETFAMIKNDMKMK